MDTKIISDEGTVNVHFSEAMQHVRAGNTEMAKQALKRAIVLEPRDAKCHYTLGGIYQCDDDYVNAAIHYCRAIELGADHESLITFAVQVLCGQSKYEQAYDIVRRWAYTHPALKDSGLQVILEELHRYVHVSRRTALDRSMLHIVLGAWNCFLQDWWSAERNFIAAISMDPDNAKAYEGAGVMYAYLSRDEEAATYLTIALQLDPFLSDAEEALEDVLQRKRVH